MRLLTAFLISLLVCLPGRAFANCSLTDVSGFGFEAVDGSSDPGLLQLGSISVACDGPGPFRLALDAGLWATETRRMSDGAGQYVDYSLWQDSGARKEWGDQGTSNVTYRSRTLQGRGGDGLNTYPVYGTVRIPKGLPAGEYRDVVQVTLSYPPFGPDDRQTATLPLSMRMKGTCSLDVGGIHGFGTWPTDGPAPMGVPLGTVSVRCPAGVYYAVGMDAGLNYDGVRRRMTDGSEFVSYVLRAESGTGNQWGDTGLSGLDASYLETHPAAAVYGRSDGGTRNFSVWGDALTTGRAPGTYRDTVNITVAW